MQGMQSNNTPEKRGLAAALAGPLEATKRYRERQHEIDSMSATKVPFSPEMPAPTGPTGGWLGHAGQSIEAAFNFEAVFQFETELEAEATEDWLDLSGKRAAGESGEPGDGVPSEELNPVSARQRAEAAGDELEDGVGVARETEREWLDRQWLTRSRTEDAAAARLQFRSERQRELERREGRGGNEEGQLSMRDETERSLVGRSDDAGGTILERPVNDAIAPSNSTFDAERRTPSDVDGEHLAATLGYSIPAVTPDPKAVRAAIFRLAQESGAGLGTERSSLNRPLQEGAFGHETSSIRDRLTLSEAEAGSPYRLEGGYDVPVEREMRSAELAKLGDSEKNDLVLPQTSAGAGDGPLDRPSEAIEVSADTEAGNGAAARTSDEDGKSEVVSSATPTARPTVMATSEGPALAHDASNLLSALKLYSELLSLSGVLQARHRHYAEDLKLLAGRSEVLIARLFQSIHPAADLVAEASPGLASRSIAASLTGEIVSSEQSSGTDGASRHLAVFDSQRDPYSTHIDALKLESSVAGEAPRLSETRDVDSTQTARENNLSADDVVDEPKEEAAAVAYEVQPDVADSGVASGLAAPLREVSSESMGEAVGNALPLLDEGSSEDTEHVNLVDLLKRWGSLLSMIAHGAVHIKFGPHADLPIPVAEEAMERILVNLVHNAMTATRDGGAIRIGVGRPEATSPVVSDWAAEKRVRPANKVVLTVDDSGCGMSEEQIAKVLGGDRHGPPVEDNSATIAVQAVDAWRPPLESRRRRGMGLQIVQELVAASGGELSIYSRCGVGTRIEIQWPALQLDALAEAQPERNLPYPASAATNISLLDARRRPPQAVTAEAVSERTDQGFEGAIAC